MRLVPVVLLAACAAEPSAFELPFAAEVAGAPFSCEATYEGLGDDGVEAWFTDARFYVQDLTFVDADGAAIPTTLDDVAFQADGVALVDFEDGEGTCGTGSPDTHTTLTGIVDDLAAVAGLRFTIGVPEAQNHLDPLDAKDPLNAPGMFWSWMGGYKFLRVDVATEARPAFFVHVGSTGCTGSPEDGFTCTNGNRIDVALDDFDPATSEVLLDLAELFAGTEIEKAPAEGDTAPGCMSGPMDAECSAIFPNLGLAWGTGSADAPTVFAVGAR